jgi:hypothetical protein
MRRGRLSAVVAGVLLALPPLAATEVPGAMVVLDVLVPPLPGYAPTGLPPRFVLLEDGTVYVGGTRDVMAGRLAPPELKAFEKRVSDVRKLPALAGVVAFGPGNERRHVVLRRGHPIEMILNGDPAAAPVALRPLAALVQDLAAFDHPSLKPYAPASYAMSAREGKPVGGCRPWTLPDPLLESVFSPRVVPAEGLGDWPTGANPATVCLGDKTYVVTFRPLLPGEKP